MAEEEEPQQEPEPDQDQAEEERLFDRLRGLIREELAEHEKRRSPQEPKPTKPETPPQTTPEPKHDDSSTPARPRRSPADVWFGRRRT